MQGRRRRRSGNGAENVKRANEERERLTMCKKVVTWSVFLGLLKMHPEVVEAAPPEKQPCPDVGILIYVKDVTLLCAVLMRAYALITSDHDAKSATSHMDKIAKDANAIMCFLSRYMHALF